MMDFRDWQGKAVLDRDGHKIGSIGQLYVDDRNDAPAWATVKSQTSENFFPVAMAHVQGDDIIVDMPEDEVTHAPAIAADEQIGTAEEQELYQYYRDKWAGAAPADDSTDDSMQNSKDSDDGRDDMAGSQDEPMASQDQQQGRVHLRKYTVTELVTDDGEVQRKEVVIERQPVDKEELIDEIGDKMESKQEKSDDAGKMNPRGHDDHMAF